MNSASRSRGRLLGALALLLLFVAGGAAAQDATTPDLPSGEATIRGRVVHRASGAAVPGADVVIYALTPSGAPGLRRMQADAQGRFEVSGIDAAGVTYLVGARYDEVSYPGARVTFEAGERVREVEVAVTERTADADGLSLESAVLRVSPVAGGLRVVETLALHLAGDRAVYVPEGERASAGPALRVAIPERASDFQMPLGVVPEGVARDGTEIRFYGPIYPGRQDLTWSYTVPGEQDDPEAPARYTLDRPIHEAIGRFELRLSDGAGRVEGGELVLEEGREDAGGGPPQRIFSRAGIAAGAPLQVAVTLPPSRVDPDAVRVVETRIIMHHDDAAADITETHRLEIGGDTAVLGTVESPLLHVWIPDGARRLRFGSDGGDVSLVPDPEGGLAAVGSAAPGPVNVELAYRLPIDEPPFELTRRFTRRVPLYTVFLADHGTWLPISDRLHRRRPARTQDLTYAHLEAFEVDPDEAVTLRLEPLPARTASPQLALQAGVALTAAALVWSLSAPLRRGRDEEAEHEDEIPATTRERNFLYTAIRDLEHDFETGKISSEDHDRLRGELRARAAALLRAEREGTRAPEPTPTPEPRADACPACGAATDPGHRFCPSCGHRLEGGS